MARVAASDAPIPSSLRLERAIWPGSLTLFWVGLPFLRMWTRVPDDYEEICQQALKEMQQPDFVATWRWVTAWGTRP